MSPRTIVIAGAGIGGLTSAHQLRRRLGDDDQVVVIDPRDELTFVPDCLWVLAGTRQPHQLTRPLARMLPTGVEHLQERVVGIDPGAHQVTTTTGELSYDKLVVALGAELAPDLLPGFTEGALDVYTLGGTLAARDALGGITEAVAMTARPR